MPVIPLDAARDDFTSDDYDFEVTDHMPVTTTFKTVDHGSVPSITTELVRVLAGYVGHVPGPWLFPAVAPPGDRFYDRPHATRLWKTQAHGKVCTVHGLRHSMAAALRNAGVDLDYVTKLLGHSSVQVTAMVYSHLTHPALAREMERALSPPGRK